jgi:hypothetical protein
VVEGRNIKLESLENNAMKITHIQIKVAKLMKGIGSILLFKNGRKKNCRKTYIRIISQEIIMRYMYVHVQM